jgi:periplasmic nitrate reductase NapD
MADELHIASAVVQCAPHKLGPLIRELVLLPGTLVHATSPEGKAVITLEAATGDAVTAAVAQIQQLDGVLSAALVYQCVDSLDAMNQEMP